MIRFDQYSMRYIPWKTIVSWRCLRCGRCCREFRINLRFYDYVRLAKYMPESVEIDHHGDPYIKMINGKCVFQNTNGLCVLQSFGMKPFICKVWPFKVFNNIKSGRKARQQNARFYFKDEEYYVYLNPFVSVCPGINRGRPKELPLTISEIIEIHQNHLQTQKYSTSTTKRHI